MDEEETLAVIIATLIVKEEKRSKESRELWGRPWIDRRLFHGPFNRLIQEIIANKSSCRNFFRTNKAQFDEILGHVKPLIQKQDTQLRSAILAAERPLDTSSCHVVVDSRLPHHMPLQDPIDHAFAIDMSTKICGM